MLKSNPLLPVVVLAVVFTALFHHQSLGLNLFLFESLFMIWIMVSGQFKWKGLLPVILGSGLLLSAVFTLITHSVFVYILNIGSLFLFAGILIYPEARSVLTTAGLSLMNLLLAQARLVNTISTTRMRNRNVGNYLKRGSIFLIPLLIIMVFILIYRKSNPVFDRVVGNLAETIGNALNSLFENVDFMILLTFFFGVLVSSFLLLRDQFKTLINNDISFTDDLIRKRKAIIRFTRFNALKNEIRAAVFLVLMLNVILLVLNGIDIYWVWFNFEWQGQYLKQFVHEGTWFLILSILISIAIVLYFFRANINFYRRNKTLKILSYIWLFQNGILAISVAIRNFWYIYYYALAYKRIGVIIFLIMTVFFLYSVYVKVRKQKTSMYLVRTNALFLYGLLLVSSLFNWDSIIARYNFSHADKSFLHLNFLVMLSDKTLPILDVPVEELKQMDSIQTKQFPMDTERNGRSVLLTPDEYTSRIESRKSDFIKRWESQGFLTWNLPEYLAYRRLKQ